MKLLFYAYDFPFFLLPNGQPFKSENLLVFPLLLCVKTPLKSMEIKAKLSIFIFVLYLTIVLNLHFDRIFSARSKRP